MFDDDTAFEDYTGFYPVANIADSGVPIRFIWEQPWSDNQQRFLTKSSRYVNFDTIGDNKFLVEMFTDNIYEVKSDFGVGVEEPGKSWGQPVDGEGEIDLHRQVEFVMASED